MDQNFWVPNIAIKTTICSFPHIYWYIYSPSSSWTNINHFMHWMLWTKYAFEYQLEIPRASLNYLTSKGKIGTK